MSLTQLEAARDGTITPEMEFVAQSEQLSVESIRQEVAAGRLVIPANRVHLAAGLKPVGIGVAVRCKINANLGNSAVSDDEEIELDKLHAAIKPSVLATESANKSPRSSSSSTLGLRIIVLEPIA